MFECRGTYEAEINYSVCLLTEMHLPHLNAIQYTLRVTRAVYVTPLLL